MSRLAPGQTLQATDLVHDASRRAEVVTLTCFGGLTADHFAEVLGVSARTVERDWRFAKVWLNGRLAESESEE